MIDNGPGRTDGGTGKILIVDDSPTNLRLLMDMLANTEYSVHPANSGEIALRFIHTYSPDLILLDILMPGIDGYEVCARLKSKPETRDIPIIFLSSANQVLDKVRAFGLGAVDYIVKPFHAEEVLARIQTHLTLRNIQHTLEQRVRERTSELARSNDQLRVSEERFRTLYDETPSMYFTVDPGGIVVSMNEFGATQLGYTTSELIGQSVNQLVEPESTVTANHLLANCLAQPGRMFHGELRLSHRDGRQIWVKETTRAIRTPQGGSVALIVCEDISKRKLSEERLSYLSYYDLLTGLPNRAHFHQRLNQAIIEADRVHRLLGLMYLDLDRFKNITDSMGYDAGDILLQQVARRFLQCGRPGDTVGRITGDEFALILSNLTTYEEAVRMVRLVYETFSHPFHANDLELFLSASIGIALYPADGAHGDVLLRNAEVACSRAKEAGRNKYFFYTTDMNASAAENLALENDLHRALERHEMTVYYQPIVNTGSGHMIGVEALLRWRHPEHGLINPDRFIALAEETGLIAPIGDWILRQACHQCRLWQRQGWPDLWMSVNLSALQLPQETFLQQVDQALAQAGLDPEFLELEITESVLIQNIGTTMEVLQSLADRGIALSIDDFGTGYSSLSYLKRFPVGVLKIDQSFTRDIPGDSDDVALVRAIISIGHALGLKIIAEGVETEVQKAFLHAQGCDALQGYLFSKPLPPDELELIFHHLD